MRLSFMRKATKTCKKCGKPIIRGQAYVEIPDKNGTVQYAHRSCLWRGTGQGVTGG